MGKPSSPPPPDYEAAAEAQAAGDLRNARYQTLANRPDIFTPEGSRTWEQGRGETFDQAGYDAAMAEYESAIANPSLTEQPPQSTGYEGEGLLDRPGSVRYQTQPPPTMPDRADFTTMADPDYWAGTTTLSPEGQAAFEANQRMQTGLANLGEQAVGQVEGLFSTPFSIGSSAPEYQGPTDPMPTYGEHRQSVIDSMMARINEDTAREEEAKRARLVSQGIPVGSDAYAREMERIDRKSVDARQQADIAAEQMAGMGYSSALAGRRMGNQEGMADFTTGLDSHRQAIQDSLLTRQTPLNEISAFRTGSQVNMPQFQPYGNQTFTGGPNYLGAAQSQGAYDMAGYNADIAQNNAMWSGLVDLGSAGIGAYPWGG